MACYPMLIWKPGGEAADDERRTIMVKEKLYAVVLERQSEEDPERWEEVSCWEADAEEDARGLYGDFRDNLLEKMVLEKFRMDRNHPLLDVRVTLEEWEEKADEEDAYWSKVLDQATCDSKRVVDDLRRERGLRPNPGRTKAEFKALRDLAGISQAEMAQVFGVETKTVKRWENPSYAPPTEAAWQFVDDFYAATREQAEREVAEALREFEGSDGVSAVGLPYCRTQDQLERRYGADTLSFEAYNAIQRWVAIRLETMGIPYIFIDQEDVDDPENES